MHYACSNALINKKISLFIVNSAARSLRLVTFDCTYQKEARFHFPCSTNKTNRLISQLSSFGAGNEKYKCRALLFFSVHSVSLLAFSWVNILVSYMIIYYDDSHNCRQILYIAKKKNRGKINQESYPIVSEIKCWS